MTICFPDFSRKFKFEKFVRSTYKIVDFGSYYFLTSTIINWRKTFISDKYFEIMMDSFNFYQKKFGMSISAFVIMPEHFHMIAESEMLSRAIQSLKSYTAKLIIKELRNDKHFETLNFFCDNRLSYKKKSNYQVWEESFHPKKILNLKMLNQKIDYIHYNPVKRNLVENPEDWKYSSARYYLRNEDCGLNITRHY